MKCVFFGTPKFAAKILSYLLEKHIPICAVVTQPDEKKNHRTNIAEVKKFLQESSYQMPILQPVKASSSAFIEIMQKLQPDLFIVAAYGQILSQKLLDVPLIDSINVHASLLPKYRGAAPIQRCIMANEKKTGITIMKMVKQLDAGDIIKTKEVPIFTDDTFCEVEERLIEAAKPLLVSTIEDYIHQNIHFVKQDDTQATYAHKITKEESKIDWHQRAQDLHNLIRALSPYPAAFCDVQIGTERKKMKILRTKIVEDTGLPGQNLVFAKNTWIVACKDRSLQILQVQLEGKKKLLTADFIRGMKSPLSFVI